jgi:16S rRNA (cytosine1402-N4)-methyltransferase
MDPSTQTLTAAEIINTYNATDLARVIRIYSDEKWASRIAEFIVKARKDAPLETSDQLVEVVKAAIPASARRAGGHPAKRTFQAIRIELNHELDVLENTLDTMIDHLNEGGRLCVITFHSLEDRIVKNKFRTAEKPCICPPEFPVCVCGRKSKGIVISRKPILPSEEELAENSRSKSAKLRIFEKRTEV